MKNILIFALLLFVVTGCNQRYSQPSYTPTTPNPSILTTERAQTAVDRFVSGNGSGRLRIRGGVREIPSENSATADLAVEDFQSGNSIFRDKDWDGQAVFSKFSDGKWTLTQIVLRNPSAYSTQTWKPVIEVQ